MLRENIDPDVVINFPRVGYFHSLAEIAQTIYFIKHGLTEKESKHIDYLFRKEPESSTPYNEFNNLLWSHAAGEAIKFSNIPEHSIIIIEAPSLDGFFHRESNSYFQWNPNKNINIPYSEIPKCGFYEKFAPELGVIKVRFTKQDFISDLKRIRRMHPNSPLIIVGHINDHSSENTTRKDLNAFLRDCCEKVSGVFYYDNRLIFEHHGYATKKDGTSDIHHLSESGEIAMGVELQSICRVINNFRAGGEY